VGRGAGDAPQALDLGLDGVGEGTGLDGGEAVAVVGGEVEPADAVGTQWSSSHRSPSRARTRQTPATAHRNQGWPLA